MAEITNIEKGAFLKLFNRGGYVLDFSTDLFDKFTQNSIGLALCDYYGVSKGKSLIAYVNEAKEREVILLLSDLLEYYEVYYQLEISGEEDTFSSRASKEYQAFYKKCRSIMDRIKINTFPFSDAGQSLKDKFSSTYISMQIDSMLKMQDENPTEAIGKSKEFIESCCKTILEESQTIIDKDWNVSQLVKTTMKLLKISIDNVDESTSESRTVKAILGNLHGIAGNIAELRNSYGSGHGKSASYKGLTVRHAKLAVGVVRQLI
ncbi:MAG: abortive infection family protein [Clostridiaceae bacterium]